MKQLLLVALALFPCALAGQDVPRPMADTALARVWVALHELDGRALALFRGREASFEGDVATDTREVTDRMRQRMATAADFHFVMERIESINDRRRVGRLLSERLAEMAMFSELEIQRLDRIIGATSVPGTALIADSIRKEVEAAVRVLRRMAQEFSLAG